MSDQRQPTPIPTLLEFTYGELHDMVSELVESGVLHDAGLHQQQDSLSNKLSYCNAHTPRIIRACQAHTGLVLAVNKLLGLLDSAVHAGFELTDDEIEARDYARLQLEALEPLSQDEQEVLSARLHAACEYLNYDRHLHDNSVNWHMDAGKLQTALEQAGLRVLP
jgi:hypothetical protein